MLETVLYAGAAGVSQVALLVAVAFWTWLWGPLGLLMATPLTVCLVVLGKYVPGLKFVATLLVRHAARSRPSTATTSACSRATSARRRKWSSASSRRSRRRQVYDALLVPALNYAERDRLEGRLEPDDEQAVIDATRELMTEGRWAPRSRRGRRRDDAAVTPSAEPRLRVLGYAANGAGDMLALEMLARLLAGLPIAIESDRTAPARLGPDRAGARPSSYDAVCIVDLPPSPPSKTRYLVQRLRAALPELPILVGRWAPPALADESCSR